jgi:hypothetical protein
MKRWMWIVLAFFISTGVYYTIRYGLRPKPIPVMNPTEFDQLEQVGVVTYNRLRTEIRSERLVLLGTSDVSDAHVWNGFLRAAVADHEHLVYFVRAGIPVDASPDWEIESFDDAAVQSGELFVRLKARLQAGRLIVVHGYSREVSHLVKDSLVARFERVVQHPVMSISSLHLAVRPEERDDLQTQCLNAGEDAAGDGRLVCAAQRVGRLFMRKSMDPAKIWAVIERHGLKEYLVFIHQP